MRKLSRWNLWGLAGAASSGRAELDRRDMNALIFDSPRHEVTVIVARGERAAALREAWEQIPWNRTETADDEWSISWMFVETRDGRKGSLRGIEYADPPVAHISCPTRDVFRIEMPDNEADDGPAWAAGDEIACPKCGETAKVLTAFWHEPYAFIEWYKEAGAGDYVEVECEDGSANFRPVSWRPTRKADW